MARSNGGKAKPFFRTTPSGAFDQYLQDIQKLPLIKDPAEERRLARRVQRGDEKAAMLRRIGDAGTASVFVSSLESPIGSKSITAVTKVLDDRVPVSYEQYVALRRYKPAPAGTEYSQGAYVSMPAYLGEAKARYRLVGEECAKCGRQRELDKPKALARDVSAEVGAQDLAVLLHLVPGPILPAPRVVGVELALHGLDVVPVRVHGGG